MKEDYASQGTKRLEENEKETNVGKRKGKQVSEKDGIILFPDEYSFY